MTEGRVDGRHRGGADALREPGRLGVGGHGQRRRSCGCRFASAAPPRPTAPGPDGERFGAAARDTRGRRRRSSTSPARRCSCVGPEAIYTARFDAARARFVRDAAFESVGVRSAAVPTPSGFATGPDGRVYVDFGRGTVVATEARGRHVGPGPHHLLPASVPARFHLYPEPDGVVWLGRGADSRFVRFDTRRAVGCRAGDLPRADPARDREPRPAAVRRRRRGCRRPSSTRPPTRLRFEFAAPGFVDESVTEYQSRLDGLETDWSAWTREARRDFTNLGLRRLPLPRPRAQRVGRGQRRGHLRVHDPAALVSHVVGLRRLHRPAGAARPSASTGCSAAASSARSASARSLPRRGCAPKSAEALARSESEGKKNVELLSEIGREITASLDFDTIFGKLYERVNQLADADVFGVGLYHPERHEIEYRLAIEKGKRYAPYSRDTTEPRPAAGLVHRAPRAGLHQRPRDRVQPLHQSLRGDQPGRSRTARCRSSRSRSSTCRCSPRTACSASSRSRASRSTPTPSITST